MIPPVNGFERFVQPDGRLTTAGMILLQELVKAAGTGGGGSTAWGDLTGVPAPISGTTAAFTTAQQTKLTGIATGATANDTDANLRDRATHTGTQAAGTITGLATVATSGAYGDLTGIPATFAPSAHTHPLSALTQSGASTGQVATWNGSAWTPAFAVGSAGPAVRILTATQTMTNNTTMQDWFSTAGGLALLANSTYEFFGSFFSINGATSHGLNMQFAAISGATIQWNAIGSKVTATAQATALRFTATDTFATARNVTTASTVTGNIVKVWGTVRTTTAGTLRPQLAQTAASGSWVAQPGTFFRAIRLGADTLTNTGEWS